MNFTQSISNEIFLNFCITLIEQIYTLSDINYDFKNYKNISKDVVQKYISYFEII